MDYEIQYKMTIDFVDQILERTKIYLMCIVSACHFVLQLPPPCTSLTGARGMKNEGCVGPANA